MDGTRFDALTRRVGHALVDRRGAIKVTAGGVVASIVGDRDHDDAGARRRCRHGRRRCGGRCRDVSTDRNNCGACGAACLGNEDCCGGLCRVVVGDPFNCGSCGFICTPTETCCDVLCVDTGANSLNCGACFNECGVHEICDGGGCRCNDDSGRCPGPAAECCPLSRTCHADGTCPPPVND